MYVKLLIQVPILKIKKSWLYCQIEQENHIFVDLTIVYIDINSVVENNNPD